MDKNKDVLALLDSGNKVNAMTLAYTAHLDLMVRLTNITMQKIERSLLIIYGMVITAFQVVDKLGCSWFFQKTFLLIDINIKVILNMLFFTVINADV